MKVADAIKWFKETYSAELQSVTTNTPFDADLLCAIAYQETGHIWTRLINKVPVSDIPLLCVGDTLDAPRRSAFPKNKAALLAVNDGQTMFDIARDSLLKMANVVPGFEFALVKPNKFCHGFGIFQYDLQHFTKDPQYFLQKQWAVPINTFNHCIKELFAAKKKQGFETKTTLTDVEKVFVAIAYNNGVAKPTLGFKQGFKSSDGRFYGENINEFMGIARTVTPTGVINPAGPAPIPPPTPVTPSNKVFRVKVTSNTLNLRSEPKIPPVNSFSNRIAALPNGHLVSLISGSPGDKWFEIETSLNGANLRGFAASEFLEKVTANSTSIPITVPFASPPQNGIVAVFMPRKAGTTTKRTELAGALSLKEPGQPSRSNSSDTAVLREELMKILDWLDVEKASHKRYQPGNGKTFCNIYAHDFCHLAGIYLPRVWWTQKAIERLARNEMVEPLLGSTIVEIRANSIFGWLRDFGERFGWRQTGELTKLQNAANLGGVGLIVAKRVDEGKSGHMTIVLPELDNVRAKRDANGEVTAPLQSQAGAINFKMSTGKAGWWLDPKFRDHAFWIHA
jgi:hypothetical protein